MSELEKAKQVAYENAMDYLYYWYSKKLWLENWHNAWLDEETSNEIWHKAYEKMASEF